MKQIAIIFGLLTFCSTFANAQLLYEISGNSTNAKSYLLATNRYTDQTFLDTIPNVFVVFGKCKQVITEFALQDYETIAALRQAALLPDSTKLKDYYSDYEYQDIEKAIFSLLGISLDQIGRMKPQYLTELYRNELLHRWFNDNEERSMETFFEQVAQQNQMPVVGLDDTGETIFMTFDREPFDYQLKELKNIITYPQREIDLETEINAMYRNGRLNDIAYLIQSPDNQSVISYSDYDIYAKRNLQWVRRLRPYLKEGQSFITLNANYLGGEKGLIAILRKEGYRVKRVNK